jgi:hypothetical protein
MLWNEPHSWLYYLLLLALGGGVVVSLPIGGLFFLKRTGVKRANIFFGLLLLAIGFTLFHNILYITSFYEHNPRFKFFPIYFTLAIPSLLFFYVKLSLFPAYRIRRTDWKHFLLPLFQWLFFWWIFFQPVAEKYRVDRMFYNPFYGGLEQAFYLVAFFAYLYFAYRYLLASQRTQLSFGQRRQRWYIRKLIKGLFVLFGIHAVFVLTDFFCYEFMYINLRSVKVYAGLGALSFAALVYFLSVYGFQVLFWGRKLFGAQRRW